MFCHYLLYQGILKNKQVALLSMPDLQDNSKQIITQNEELNNIQSSNEKLQNLPTSSETQNSGAKIDLKNEFNTNILQQFALKWNKICVNN